MKHLLFIVFIALISTSIGCQREGDFTTEAAREKGTSLTDNDLRDRIQMRINSDPQLKEANLSVEAHADRNHAVISGAVESEELRTRAVSLAESAYPNISIENRIEVKAREMTRDQYTPEQARRDRERAKANKETIGDTLDDAWIHSKIKMKLITEGINVDVEDNVVTLRGTVDSAEDKAEAERIARETDGVKRVINRLRVESRR